MNNKSWLWLAIAVSGCASDGTPPKTEFSLPQGLATPIYVTAARQKADIIQSLRKVGFNIVDNMEDSDYLLRATIGVDQGSQDCGTRNNVRYQIRYRERTVAEAGAKGWTGSCRPNVFDEVSQSLRQQLIPTNSP